MEGTNEVAPEPAHKDFPTWEQGASRVLYCLAPCVHVQMLAYMKNVMPRKDHKKEDKDGQRHGEFASDRKDRPEQLFILVI